MTSNLTVASVLGLKARLFGTVERSMLSEAKFGVESRVATAREAVSATAGSGLKRLFDVVTAAVLLFLAAPLVVVVAAAILWQRDGGSIFYGQKRICRSGRQFYCYKFRSMCPDADERLRQVLARDAAAQEEWALTHKLRNDPRVTPVGRFLRASSLDELPQLWNVLKGDLSLVGPRPVTQAELDGPYTTHRGRTEYLSVRPGITGLWQVSGRSLVGYEERVALDKKYVQTLSVRGDLHILWRTVGVVLGRKGAC